MNELPAIIQTAAPRKLEATSANWRALTTSERIDEHARLLPVATCQAVLGELASLPTETPKEHAANLVAIVIGSYPNTRHVGDPEIYSRAIVSLFEEHGPDVGREAVDIITRSCKFLPSRAEVHQVLEEIERKRRVAAYVAKQMLAEHERRATEAAQRKREAEDGVKLDFSEILKGLSKGVSIAGATEGAGVSSRGFGDMD